jgi:hypothetical protein
MAQSRIQQQSLPELIAAMRNPAAAQGIQSAEEGFTKGMGIADSIRAKQQAQQQAQQEMAMKVADFVRKANELKLGQDRFKAEQVPVTEDKATAPTKLFGNAPVGSYDPNADKVTPGYEETRNVMPDAFNAMNPAADKVMERSLLKQGVDPSEVVSRIADAKTPGTNTIIGNDKDNPNKLYTHNTRTNTVGSIDAPLAMNPTSSIGSARIETKVADQTKQMSEALDTSRWPRTSSGGRAAATLQAGEKMMPLIEQMRQQAGNGDQRQMLELARNLDVMLSNSGISSEKITHELVPQTMWGKIRSIQEYVQNAPQGQDLGAFVDRTADTINREMNIAKQQTHEYALNRTSGYTWLKEHAPENFNGNIVNAGFDPKEFVGSVEKGRRDKIDKPGTTSTPATANDYLSKFNKGK